MDKHFDFAVPVAIFLSGLLISGSLVFGGVQIAKFNVLQRDVLVKILRGELEDEVVVSTENSEKEETTSEELAESEETAVADFDLKNIAMTSKVKAFDAEYDNFLGNEDARISIVEFSDYNCGYCARLHPTLKEVVSKYPADVNWAYRYYPILGSKTKSLAAECIAQDLGKDAFWKFSDALFSDGADDTSNSLVALAKELKLDSASLKTCIESEEFITRIDADLSEGGSIGISGTPTNVIIDNKTGEQYMLVGAESTARFSSIIEAILAS
jgi:protein-disulfide isomerase